MNETKKNGRQAGPADLVMKQYNFRLRPAHIKILQDMDNGGQWIRSVIVPLLEQLNATKAAENA